MKNEDKWKHRSKNMSCKTCMYYLNTRCRRHAPTMQGYPAVFEEDFCGDHKLDKETMKKQNDTMEKQDDNYELYENNNINISMI